MTEQKKPTRRAAPKKAAEAAEPKQTKVTLVKMVREDGKTADVHPQEVDNYRSGGYREA
jgi:hypothetical protein